MAAGRVANGKCEALRDGHFFCVSPRLFQYLKCETELFEFSKCEPENFEDLKNSSPRFSEPIFLYRQARVRKKRQIS